MTYKAVEKDSLMKMYKNRDVPNLQFYMVYVHSI